MPKFRRGSMTFEDYNYKQFNKFIDKLTQMCKILSDTEIKYKKANPFDK